MLVPVAHSGRLQEQDAPATFGAALLGLLGAGKMSAFPAGARTMAGERANGGDELRRLDARLRDVRWLVGKRAEGTGPWERGDKVDRIDKVDGGEGDLIDGGLRSGLLPGTERPAEDHHEGHEDHEGRDGGKGLNHEKHETTRKGCVAGGRVASFTGSGSWLRVMVQLPVNPVKNASIRRLFCQPPVFCRSFVRHDRSIGL